MHCIVLHISFCTFAEGIYLAVPAIFHCNHLLINRVPQGDHLEDHDDGELDEEGDNEDEDHLSDIWVQKRFLISDEYLVDGPKDHLLHAACLLFW